MEGFLYVRKDGVAEINYYNNELGIERYTHEVDSNTICQYTGLTDKNGNKIWENDVVEGLFLYGAKVSAIVAFENGAFGLTWSRGNVEEFSPFTSICNVSFEVIGNIFSGYTKH